MISPRLLPVCLALCSLVLCSPILTAHPKPNILLLVAEDMSPRLGSYGDTVARTPNLDALAQTATRYSNTFTTAGVCAPSRAALITGQHQISFAAQHMRTSTGPFGKYYAQPPPQVRAFPELLRQHGYYTFTDTKLDYQFSGIRAGSGPFTIWDQDGAADTGWRQRQSDQPFFALINFLETHESGVMRATGPAHSDAHRQTQQMRKAAGLVAATLTPPDAVQLPPYYPDLPEVRADLARHYDNIHNMDKRVGNILAALAADGLLDNTVIIWTTDHGDGLPRAKRELYHSGIHVPFMISLPTHLRRHFPSLQPGQVDPRIVSFVDIAPTILALADVAAPDYLHGQSIFRSQREYAFAARDRIDEIADRQRAVTNGEYKYIRSWHPQQAAGHHLAYRDNLDMVRAMRQAFAAGQLNPAQQRWFQAVGKEQLYHLPSDPHELENLSEHPAHQQAKQLLSNALQQFLVHVGDTGAMPEPALRKSLLQNGEVPVTPAPTIHATATGFVIRHAMGSSTGYRFQGETKWRLYGAPVIRSAAPRNTKYIEAKSVRYGWQESAVQQLKFAAMSHK